MFKTQLYLLTFPHLITAVHTEGRGEGKRHNCRPIWGWDSVALRDPLSATHSEMQHVFILCYQGRLLRSNEE